MNILVPIKRVIDPYVAVKLDQDFMTVQAMGVKQVINPFDEVAIEAALQLREQALVNEVTVISVGPFPTQETLRTALALGADNAIWIDDQNEVLSPLSLSKTLAAWVKKQPDYPLILLGKQAIDDESSQVGPMLATLLNWPCLSYASELKWESPVLTVCTEVEGGTETLSLSLPAVVSTDLHLNTPRYPSLPNIMKAKSKPLTQLLLSDLITTQKPQVKRLSLAYPKPRKTGRQFTSVESLLVALKEDKVIK